MPIKVCSFLSLLHCRSAGQCLLIKGCQGGGAPRQGRSNLPNSTKLALRATNWFHQASQARPGKCYSCKKRSPKKFQKTSEIFWVNRNSRPACNKLAPPFSLVWNGDLVCWIEWQKYVMIQLHLIKAVNVQFCRYCGAFHKSSNKFDHNITAVSYH